MEQPDWSPNPPHYLSPRSQLRLWHTPALEDGNALTPHCLSLCISSSVPNCPSQKPIVRNNQCPSSWTTSPRALGYFSSLSPKEIILWTVGLSWITPACQMCTAVCTSAYPSAELSQQGRHVVRWSDDSCNWWQSVQYSKVADQTNLGFLPRDKPRNKCSSPLPNLMKSVHWPAKQICSGNGH